MNEEKQKAYEAARAKIERFFISLNPAKYDKNGRREWSAAHPEKIFYLGVYNAEGAK